MIPNSTTATNGSVVVVDGRPIHVRQGPEWLVRLLYDPPGWLVAAVVVGVLVVVGLAARTVYLDGEAALADASDDMVRNAAIVVGVVVVTKASMATLALAYWGDVLLGWLGGSALGIGVTAALGGLAGEPAESSKPPPEQPDQ